MKLQINNKEALERLIGGDNETEMTIRNNIVQDFTRNHLKALVNNEGIQKAVNEVQSLLRQEVTKQLTEQLKVSHWHSDTVLNSATKQLIDSHTNNTVYQSVYDVAVEQVIRLSYT